MGRTRKSTNENNSSLHSDPQNGVVIANSKKNAIGEALEIEPIDGQTVNMRGKVRFKNKNPTLPPSSPNTEASAEPLDDAEEAIFDFEDLIDQYGSEQLTCWVYKCDPQGREKAAYSMQFPFSAQTVLPTIQDAHPEGGKFKIRILNDEGKYVRGYTIPVTPSLAYRMPGPKRAEMQQNSAPVDPMAFMKPMLEMQGVMFAQMQTVMQLNSTMMTGLMTQMKTLTEIRPETQSPTAMLKEVMGLFGQVKEAQATIGGVSGESSGEPPTTWVDVVNNVLTTSVERNPKLVERGLGVIEKLVGLGETAVNPQTEKRVDGEAEVIHDDEEEEPAEQTEEEKTVIKNEEELKKIQQEVLGKFELLKSDWLANNDPRPAALWMKSYIQRFRNTDPNVRRASLLFMLTPEIAFEQLKDELLGQEMYDKLKATPHYLDWLKKFMEIAK